VLASVALSPSVPVVGPGGRIEGSAKGYYQNFGLTATSKRAAELLVEQSISDGHLLWNDSKMEELSFPEARSLVGNTTPLDLNALQAQRSGIWYRSGRVLY
jgi:hypothetical protein